MFGTVSEQLLIIELGMPSQFNLKDRVLKMA